jgi:hypothetical protein
MTPTHIINSVGPVLATHVGTVSVVLHVEADTARPWLHYPASDAALNTPLMQQGHEHSELVDKQTLAAVASTSHCITHSNSTSASCKRQC